MNVTTNYSTAQLYQVWELNKVLAIKMLRGQCDASLKEAKDAFETSCLDSALQRNHDTHKRWHTMEQALKVEASR